MAMKRCPVCGEKFSDTYKNCPFCEEEAALREGDKIRRGGRRAAHGRQYSLITPTLIVLILIMACLLVYLLYGDQIAQKFSGGAEQDNQQEDVVTPQKPTQSGMDEEEENPDENTDGVMPADPDDTDTDTTTPSATTDYEKAMALPDGLSLSTTDFTLKTVGETAAIQVSSGGSGSYTWVSQDPNVATVDQNGKVTAVSKGTVNVVVSDGSRKGVCIVRCNVSGSAAPTTGTTTTGSGTLKAGAATVVNGGSGVFVRSGPGTSYEALATVSNGADVQIVESAGDGWYKITFSGIGGATTTGYMKGDFLENQ